MSIQDHINDYQKIVQNNYKTIIVSASFMGGYCMYKYMRGRYSIGDVIDTTILSTVLSGPLVFEALYNLPYVIPGISIIALVKWWREGF